MLKIVALKLLWWNIFIEERVLIYFMFLVLETIIFALQRLLKCMSQICYTKKISKLLGMVKDLCHQSSLCEKKFTFVS